MIRSVICSVICVLVFFVTFLPVDPAHAQSVAGGVADGAADGAESTSETKPNVMPDIMPDIMPMPRPVGNPWILDERYAPMVVPMVVGGAILGAVPVVYVLSAHGFVIAPLAMIAGAGVSALVAIPLWDWYIRNPIGSRAAGHAAEAPLDPVLASQIGSATLWGTAYGWELAFVLADLEQPWFVSGAAALSGGTVGTLTTIGADLLGAPIPKSTAQIGMRNTFGLMGAISGATLLTPVLCEIDTKPNSTVCRSRLVTAAAVATGQTLGLAVGETVGFFGEYTDQQVALLAGSAAVGAVLGAMVPTWLGAGNALSPSSIGDVMTLGNVGMYAGAGIASALIIAGVGADPNSAQ